LFIEGKVCRPARQAFSAFIARKPRNRIQNSERILEFQHERREEKAGCKNETRAGKGRAVVVPSGDG
jgi:hypothetical protein